MGVSRLQPSKKDYAEKKQQKLFINKASHDPQTHTEKMEQNPEFLITEHKKKQRQKQLDLWYNSPEYKAYIARVPKSRRGPKDPKTPRIEDQRSKRSFDGLIREWKLRVKQWYQRNMGRLPDKPAPQKGGRRALPRNLDPMEPPPDDDCPPDGPDPILPGYWEDCVYIPTGNGIDALLVRCVQCGKPATEMCSVCMYAVCGQRCFYDHF